MRQDKLERLLSIRERALELLRKVGTWQEISGQKYLAVDRDRISITHRTPFQKLPAEGEEVRYMRALLNAKADMPYELDIWHDRKKVLTLGWDEEGNFDVRSYKPGDWEMELAAATAESTEP